jgi:hypothetical protein
MLEITLPEETIGAPGADEIAVGPFAVEHNGEMELGAHLERNGDILQLWIGGRSLDFDSTYVAEESEDHVTLYSPVYESTVTLRALQIEDAEWAMSFDPDYEPESVEALREDVLRLLDAGF